MTTKAEITIRIKAWTWGEDGGFFWHKCSFLDTSTWILFFYVYAVISCVVEAFKHFILGFRSSKFRLVVMYIGKKKQDAKIDFRAPI